MQTQPLQHTYEAKVHQRLGGTPLMWDPFTPFPIVYWHAMYKYKGFVSVIVQQ